MLLAFAQLVPARSSIEPIEGERVRGFEGDHGTRLVPRSLVHQGNLDHAGASNVASKEEIVMATINERARTDHPHSTAKIGGHPIHPMLIPFPIVCFIGVLVTDIV